MSDVFLSSSFTELREYRNAAFEVIDRFGHLCVRMENFPSSDRAVEGFCRDKVSGCKLFVLILGKLYGSVIPGRDISYTEDEFDLATELKVPCLVFTASVRANVNVVEALDRSAMDYKEHRQRLAAFQKKALKGRLGCEYNDPSDLREKLGHSLHEHFKPAATTLKTSRYNGEMLPNLCDRTPQVDNFGEAFEVGRPGEPEIYVLYGHELEQHKYCVQRLLCLNIMYPKRGSPTPLLAPPTDRAVIEWPFGDGDSEDIVFNRLCRRLLQAIVPGCGAPKPNAVEMFCRLALEARTPYLRFRHVFHADEWTDGAQALCLRYLKFWGEVKKQFAATGDNAPRILIFFEFCHNFQDPEHGRPLRQSLHRVFLEDAAGEGLSRKVLPELPSVGRRDLELWYQRFEDRLLPHYQSRAIGEVFPEAPLSMLRAQSRLRQLLGLETNAE